MSSTTLPLHGLRVLDLSRALAGPFCTAILGDLGADVVKVEPIDGGEMVRTWGPFDRGISTYYLSVNRNKRSLAVNFRDTRSLDLLRELAAKVDVVVENFKRGVAEDMGLGYDILRESSPRLIYTSISAFGQDGPYALLPGVDQIAQGMSGVISLTGENAANSVRVGIPIGDLTAGMWAALGTQSAIIQRMATGLGQRVDIALLSSLVALLCVHAQRYLSLGEIAKPTGNHHPVLCPYGVFNAKDGPFSVAVVTDEMWRNLCAVVGLVARDLPESSDNTLRVAHRVEIERILNERFADRNAHHWVTELAALGIPSGAINDMEAVFKDPQVCHEAMVEEIEHPLLGQLRQLASPIKIEGMGGRSVRRAPPLLGQHSREILTEFGLSDQRITALLAAGLVGQHDRV